MSIDQVNVAEAVFGIFKSIHQASFCVCACFRSQLYLVAIRTVCDLPCGEIPFPTFPVTFILFTTEHNSTDIKPQADEDVQESLQNNPKSTDWEKNSSSLKIRDHKSSVRLTILK